MNFENEANEKCIEEFDIREDMPSVISIKKGILNIKECKISLDGISQNNEDKVPCVVGHSKT